MALLTTQIAALHNMPCSPVYVSPERVRLACIKKLDELMADTSGDWVHPSSILFSHDGPHALTHKLMSHHSFNYLCVCGISKVLSWIKRSQSITDRDVYNALQILISVHSYSSLWLEPGVVGAHGEPVPLDQRFVLDPAVLHRILAGEMRTLSVKQARQILHDVPVVPLEQVTDLEWRSRGYCRAFCRAWHTGHHFNEVLYCACLFKRGNPLQAL